MAKPKREKPAIRLFVTTDRANGERLGRIAVKATKEAGTIVSANTIHGRGMPAMLAALDSCRECRAGTCDGSVHVRPSNSSKVSNGCQDEPRPDAVVVKNAEQTTVPKSVEPNDKTSAAAQVESFFLKPEPPSEPKQKRAPVKRAYPEGFVLTDEMRAYATKNGIAADRVEGMFEHFSNHHRAKGSKFVDWTLAFYTWVRNDRQYGGKNQATAGQPSAIQGGKDELPW